MLNLNPVFLFDTIFDRDVGMVSMLKQNNLDDICDIKKLSSMSDGEILSLIVNRDNPNILSCLPMLTTEYDETLELLNTLYGQDILDLSPLSDFAYLAVFTNNLKLKDISSCTIVISSDEERRIIESVPDFKDMQIIHRDELKNPRPMDPIYAKSYLDFFHKDGCFYGLYLTNKNIYIQNTVYNTLSEEIEKSDLLKKNKIGLYGMWSLAE